MLERFKGPVRDVMGHAIAEPALTWQGIALIAVTLSLPVLVVGGLLDLAMQFFFGWCTGLWCLAGS